MVSLLLIEAPFVDDLERGLSNVYTFVATLRSDSGPPLPRLPPSALFLSLTVLMAAFLQIFKCVGSTDPSYNWRVFVLSCVAFLVLFQRKS